MVGTPASSLAIIARMIQAGQEVIMKDGEEISWRQSLILRELLPPGTPTGHLTRREAAGLIKLHLPNAAWRALSPTGWQMDFLEKRKLWREGMTRGEASEVIGEVMKKEGIYRHFI